MVLFLLAVSAVCTWFSATYFTTAFPALSLELKMSRVDAIAQAGAIAVANANRGFASRPLSNANQTQDPMFAASFGGDNEVQHFVELAGGGNEVFKEMINRVSISQMS